MGILDSPTPLALGVVSAAFAQVLLHLPEMSSSVIATLGESKASSAFRDRLFRARRAGARPPCVRARDFTGNGGVIADPSESF